MDVLAYKLNSNRYIELEHLSHSQRLVSQKKMLNTSTPESFLLSHSPSKISRPVSASNYRRRTVAADNGKLMQSINRIMTCPVILEKRKKMKSRNETGNRIEATRITLENRKLADRLENMKPMTPSLTVSKLFEESKISRAYCQNAQKMNRRTISPISFLRGTATSSTASGDLYPKVFKQGGIRRAKSNQSILTLADTNQFLAPIRPETITAECTPGSSIVEEEIAYNRDGDSSTSGEKSSSTINSNFCEF